MSKAKSNSYAKLGNLTRTEPWHSKNWMPNLKLRIVINCTYQSHDRAKWAMMLHALKSHLIVQFGSLMS